MLMKITPQDRHQMQIDIINTALAAMNVFDIRRQKTEANTDLGGVSITSTAIETQKMELQHLRGDETVEIGGKRIEADYRGFVQVGTNILESDTITPDSGTTRYQIKFVQNLWQDHIEFFAQKVD